MPSDGAASPMIRAPVSARIMKSYSNKSISLQSFPGRWVGRGTSVGRHAVGRRPVADAGFSLFGVRMDMVVLRIGVVPGRLRRQALMRDLTLVHHHGPVDQR